MIISQVTGGHPHDLVFFIHSFASGGLCVRWSLILIAYSTGSFWTIDEFRLSSHQDLDTDFKIYIQYLLNLSFDPDFERRHEDGK